MIIRAIASALPSRVYESSTVAEWCKSDPLFLYDKVGIHRRHFLEATDDELELAILACQRLFEKSQGIDAKKIGLCIYVGQSKTRLIPHASAILQHRLGLEQGCACFDMGLACSGYVYALSVAKSFMESQKVSHALLVTCDPYSKIMGRHNRDTVPLFGDAATASWLSQSGTGLEVKEIDLGTDGSKASYLECTGHGIPEFELTMNGRGIFNFAMQCVPKTVQKCLMLNGKTKYDIDFFVFHQANAFLLRSLGKVMDIDEKKILISMEDVGNTVSSSIPLVLEKFFHSFTHGQQLLLCGFGGGLSWGTACITFKGKCNE